MLLEHEYEHMYNWLYKSALQTLLPPAAFTTHPPLRCNLITRCVVETKVKVHTQGRSYNCFPADCGMDSPVAIKGNEQSIS